MKKLINIFVFFIIVAIMGCAATKPPKLMSPEKAAIGVCVETLAPINLTGGECADMVYFIRLEEDDDLCNAGYCIQSNFKKGDQIYLLNAKPGRYSMVAAYRVQSTPLAPTVKYTTIFSKDILELARKDVEAGKMTFMGKYSIDQSVGISDEADEAQLYYKEIIAPGKSTSFLGAMFSGHNFYEGTLSEGECDNQTEEMFLKNALKQFEGTEWVSLIQNSLNDLESIEK